MHLQSFLLMDPLQFCNQPFALQMKLQTEILPLFYAQCIIIAHGVSRYWHSALFSSTHHFPCTYRHLHVYYIYFCQEVHPIGSAPWSDGEYALYLIPCNCSLQLQSIFFLRARTSVILSQYIYQRGQRYIKLHTFITAPVSTKDRRTSVDVIGNKKGG